MYSKVGYFLTALILCNPRITSLRCLRCVHKIFNECAVSAMFPIGTGHGKNLLLDLQRKLHIIKVRWQVKKGR